MSYSDYGGFAYRNGILQEERSDCVLSLEGIKSTPGAWPGWTLQEGRGGNCLHVVMGDGPIFVGALKQSYVEVSRLGKCVDLVELAPTEGVVTYGDNKRYIDEDYFRDNEKPFDFTVDGNDVEIRWTHEDNYYVYIRMVQPDGVIWSGWSGYGVGAGHNGGYGYSNAERDQQMEAFWPDCAIRE